MTVRKTFIRFAALLAILGVLSSVLPAPFVKAAGSTFTFKPVADSYISVDAPETNFGTNRSIRVDASPALRSYLRFDVSGLDGAVSSAKLRILANSASDAGYSVKTVSDTSWDENAIKWSNAPQIGGLVNDSGSVKAGDWISVDVTSVVRGNGAVSLALTTPGDTNLNMAAREEGSGSAPQLVIITGSGIAPARPPATATPTQPPAATATPTQPPAGTATPNPTQPPVSGDSLNFPIRAAFYYPWFPNAWTQQGINPYTNYTPTNGYYDSGDQAMIRKHIQAMQYGNIQAGIASWWGQGHHTDSRIPAILAATAGSSFRWSLYYENESQGNPSASQITNDLTYIRDRYGRDPSYLRVNGKFVVFVYADGADACGMADRWKQGNTVGAYIVLKVFPGYGSCGSQPDSWHQYSPAVATDSQGTLSYTISPGFWLKGSAVRLGRDLNRWIGNVRSMAASGAKWQLVTTFNEWGEGTIVESAREWATASGYGAYMDALHNNGSGGPAPTATPTQPPAGTATPTPTPNPTQPPPPPSGGDAVLVGAGDISIASGTGDEQTSALLGNIPGTIFTLGDNSNESGTAAQYNNLFNPTWGRYKDRIRPAAGNHDYGTAGASAYYAYFGAAAGPAGKGYYSYNAGSWHIVVLNGNCSEVGGCGAGSTQERWLRADLAANPSQCTLTYWHQPRFSSGADHGDNSAYQPLWQALYDAGAEIVMNGHSHHYERFAPQTPSGSSDALRGVREFIVGTGGAMTNIGGGIGTVKANSEVRNAGTLGVLKLTLRSGSYSWNFVPVAGKTFTDSGSDVCH